MSKPPSDQYQLWAEIDQRIAWEQPAEEEEYLRKHPQHDRNGRGFKKHMSYWREKRAKELMVQYGIGLAGDAAAPADDDFAPIDAIPDSSLAQAPPSLPPAPADVADPVASPAASSDDEGSTTVEPTPPPINPQAARLQPVFTAEDLYDKAEHCMPASEAMGLLAQHLHDALNVSLVYRERRAGGASASAAAEAAAASNPHAAPLRFDEDQPPDLPQPPLADPSTPLAVNDSEPAAVPAPRQPVPAAPAPRGPQLGDFSSELSGASAAQAKLRTTYELPVGEPQLNLTVKQFMVDLVALQDSHKLPMDAMNDLNALLRRYFPTHTTNVPKSRGNYIRLLESLDLNTRFYPMCVHGCCVCSVRNTHCPECGDDLRRPDGKWKRLFLLRDPNLHDFNLREAGAPFEYAEKILDAQRPGVLTDMYHGANAARLMRVNPPPLPRPATAEELARTDLPNFQWRGPSRLTDTRVLNEETRKYTAATQQYRRHHSVPPNGEPWLNVSRGDRLLYMHSDSFQLYDWVHGPSMYTAQLIWADLPPQIRLIPGIAFLFFGFLGKPATNMNPFVRLAIQPLLKSLQGAYYRLYLGGLLADEVALKLFTLAKSHGSVCACENCHLGGVLVGRHWCLPFRSDDTIDTYERNWVTMDDVVAGLDLLADLRRKGEASEEHIERVQRYFGYKGTSALLDLPYFDLISSCAHDVLHRLSIGIVKTAIEVTLGRPEGVKKGVARPTTLLLPPSLRRFVSDRITAISPQLPSEHHATLKDPILHWKWYTGGQLGLFVLVLPDVLASISAQQAATVVRDAEEKGPLDPIELAGRMQRLICMWRSIRALFVSACKFESTPEHRAELRQCAMKVGMYWTAFLGDAECTYNFHMPVHFARCVLEHGPMPNYWFFMFERTNIELTRSVHNTREDTILRQMTRYRGLREAMLRHFMTQDVLPDSLPTDIKQVLKRIQQCKTGYFVPSPPVLSVRSPDHQVTLTNEETTALRNGLLALHVVPDQSHAHHLAVANAIHIYKYARCKLDLITFKGSATLFARKNDGTIDREINEARGSVVAYNCILPAVSYGVIRFFLNVYAYANDTPYAVIAPLIVTTVRTPVCTVPEQVEHYEVRYARTDQLGGLVLVPISALLRKVLLVPCNNTCYVLSDEHYVGLGVDTDET